MDISFRRKVQLVGACLLAGAAARGQQAQSEVARIVDALDVAVVYNPLVANVVDGNRFSMQGGSVQVHGQFWRGLGVVAEVSELHAAHMSGSGAGLDMLTAAFGPRYAWSPEHRRYTLFGQVLAGEANGMNSVFPASSGLVDNAHSLALYVGGGVNLNLSHLNRHFTLRAFEADWLRTQMPNAATGVQNNLRLGAGLVFQFKPREK
jgi:hypothetical protein